MRGRSDKVVGLEYINPAEAQFMIKGGVVSLRLGEKFYPKVDVYLAFPFSHPDKFISVRDPEGDEIGLVRSIDELDENSQEAIMEDLKWRYFTPKIERLTSFKEEFGHAYWEVVTNRGTQKFITRRHQAVRFVSENRYLVIDVSGNRFEIPDITKLDNRSRLWVDGMI